jgi:hypothetical protein
MTTRNYIRVGRNEESPEILAAIERQREWWAANTSEGYED